MSRIALSILAMLLLFNSSSFRSAGGQQPGAQDQQPRFGSVIETYLQEDRTAPPPKGAILFIGSSILRRWVHLKEQMGDLPVFNRAFGGSRTSEVLFYMDRIVLPYEPRFIVYYCGSNDVNAGEKPFAIFSRFKEFAERVGKQLPDTRIFYLSIIRAPQKRTKWDLVDSTNALVSNYCSVTPLRRFIDINPVFFDRENRPRGELYVSDSLHITERAYEELADTLRPLLRQAWKN